MPIRVPSRRGVVSGVAPGDAAARCLACGAPLVGAHCAECGQRAVDPDASTWSVVREAVAEAIDVDGRALRTARALLSPGLLTTEFLRGRRAPYVGPLKLFLLAGAALSTTWVLTRRADARYYGIGADVAAAGYIETVVYGSLAAGLVIAFGSWLLARGRRRLLDDAVFALHLLAALSLLTAAAVWIGTGWKLYWGSVGRVPGGVPSLPFLLFAPAAVLGAGYVAAAIRRVHAVAWWAAIASALLLGGVSFGAIMGVLVLRPLLR